MQTREYILPFCDAELLFQPSFEQPRPHECVEKHFVAFLERSQNDFLEALMHDVVRLKGEKIILWISHSEKLSIECMELQQCGSEKQIIIRQEYLESRFSQLHRSISRCSFW